MPNAYSTKINVRRAKGPSVREKILLAAHLFLSHAPSASGAPHISKEALVIIAWCFFPESFGMRRTGMAPSVLSRKHPDSNRVQAKLAGSDGIIGLGWMINIEGEAGTEHALTKKGISRAQHTVMKKLGGVLPTLQVEPDEETLDDLGIKESFISMKAALAKKEECPDSIKRPTGAEDEPERSDPPSTADAASALIEPVAKRKRGGSPKDPIPTKIEPVTPPQELVVRPIIPEPPPDREPVLREPISHEDLQMLDRLAKTPIAKMIFSRKPTRAEAVTFLSRFDANATRSAPTKIAHLKEALDRINDQVTDKTNPEIRRAHGTVLRALEAVRAYFGPRS
ncbi:hypothetical protein KBB27_04190 [Patescibacteria group bacterium]|nr:hypothetical protein [Patescibacteria group bacterium]